jgi:hypothetical protein
MGIARDFEVLRHVIRAVTSLWVSPAVDERTDPVAGVALNYNEESVREKVKEIRNTQTVFRRLFHKALRSSTIGIEIGIDKPAFPDPDFPFPHDIRSPAAAARMMKHAPHVMAFTRQSTEFAAFSEEIKKHSCTRARHANHEHGALIVHRANAT